MDRVSKAERELVRKMQRLTNYDRIISKTPEELAKFLYIKTCEDGYPQFDNIPGWLDWLKQEATDES